MGISHILLPKYNITPYIGLFSANPESEHLHSQTQTMAGIEMPFLRGTSL